MSRSLFIDGFDPDVIPGFEIDAIRPDAIPAKVINAVRLALADGEKFIGSKYVNKNITVTGHFFAGTRAAYEAARDTFLGVFDPERVISLVFEQSGEDRRYNGVYENIIFDYKDNGTCIVTINFRCTDPFGYTVATETFYQNSSITDEINEVIESRGNVYGLAKVVANVVDIDNVNVERTMTLTVSQGVRTFNLQITRLWALNDTVTIDSVRQRVYVNGQQVEFTGRWPQVLKTNTFRFNMLNAASFEIDLSMTYNPRWL